MITILFFAQLREQLQCEKIALTINEPINILAVQDIILKQYPDWNSYLTDKKILFAVNHTLVKASHIVNDGDEVAFFPPVTGG